MKTARDLTPRQLVAGLMRGDKATLKLGYGPEAAVAAASRIGDLDIYERTILTAYAEGFADGFVEDGRRGNPASRISDAIVDDTCPLCGASPMEDQEGLPPSAWCSCENDEEA